MPQEKRKKNFPCIGCRQHVKIIDKAVQCSLCGLWIHKDCASMEDELFKYLVDEFSLRGSIEWKCDSCKETSKRFHTEVLAVKKSVTTLEKKQTEQNDVIAKMEERIQALEDSSKSQGKKNDILQDSISSSIYTEQKERSSRKDNIIIHSLVEVADDVNGGDERRQADIIKIQELVQQINADVNALDDIRFCARLGEKKKGEGLVGPRPLLVGFTSSEVKEKIMQKAKKLKDLNEPWCKIKIVHDITARQRKEEKELFEEAERKNKAMSGDASANFQWVVVGRRGERSMKRVKKKQDGKQMSPVGAPLMNVRRGPERSAKSTQ